MREIELTKKYFERFGKTCKERGIRYALLEDLIFTLEDFIWADQIFWHPHDEYKYVSACAKSAESGYRDNYVTPEMQELKENYDCWFNSREKRLLNSKFKYKK